MFLFRYFPFVKLSFKNYLQDRLKLFFRLAMCFLFMVIFIELWRLIDREGFLDIPYDIIDVAWYVSFTQMFLFLSPRMFMVIEDDVRSGDIAYFLIRPISYLRVKLMEGLGMLAGNIAVYYSFGVLGLWLYIGALPSGGIGALILTMLLVYLGSVLHLVFQLIIGVSALWLQEAEPLYRVYQKFLIVLGGLYMPVSLYPEWVGTVSSFTPFYTMMYLSASPTLDFEKGLLMAIPYFIFWFAFSILLMGWIYRACTRRLEVNGG
ncbi:MAG: ABC transporter permease [Bdellovibrionales bacterium]